MVELVVAVPDVPLRLESRDVRFGEVGAGDDGLGEGDDLHGVVVVLGRGLRGRGAGLSGEEERGDRREHRAAVGHHGSGGGPLLGCGGARVDGGAGGDDARGGGADGGGHGVSRAGLPR